MTNRRIRVAVLAQFLKPEELADLLRRYDENVVRKGPYHNKGVTEQDRAAYADYLDSKVTLDAIAKKHGYRSPGSVKSAFERVLCELRNK